MTPLELLEQVRELQKVDANLSTEEATEIIRASGNLDINQKSLDGIHKGIDTFDQLIQHVVTNQEPQNMVLCELGSNLVLVRAHDYTGAIERLHSELGDTVEQVRPIRTIYSGQELAFVNTHDLSKADNSPRLEEKTYCLQLKGVRYLTAAHDIHEAIERYNESDQVPSFAYTDSDIKELNFSQQIAVL
jgi:hypothetical protein